jgi:hypothetical protein
MTVPPITDPIWTDIVSGRTRPDFGFLAIRILLGRLQPAAKRELTKVPQFAHELHALIAANAHLPSVQRDLATLTR